MDEQQFSIRDVLWCVTLISVGLGCFRLAQNTDYAVAAVFGMAAIVSGLFAPFHRKAYGAFIVLGAALAVVLVLVLQRP